MSEVEKHIYVNKMYVYICLLFIAAEKEKKDGRKDRSPEAQGTHPEG